MTKIKKVDLESKDIKSEQVEKLKRIFPEIVADGKINFEQLKATLGEEIDDSRERFGMSWAGKSKCFRIIQDPSTGTLKPSRKESINFDTTNNLFLEGDNLEVLKLLQKSYYEKIRMIYIDPPYNTGSDFVYNDKFGQQLNEYLKVTGQTDDEGRKLSTNTDSSGRFHSDWMNMIYPRLFLARNLLSDDGVIFISIDDGEVANLRKIGDEIFGEENFIINICHKARASVSNDKIISPNHNHILVYAKNERVIFNKRSEFGSEPNLDGFNLKDERGEYKLVPVDGPGGAKKGNPHYEFLGVEGYWRFSKETMQKKYDDGFIVKTKNNLQQKYYKKDAENTRKTVTSWWDEKFYTSEATKKLNTFLGTGIFDTPKPVELVEKMITVSTDNDSYILDFFAGSGTTAEAVLRQNYTKGTNRKFICIQLPELTDEKSEAYKAGYKNIADISKERIRRVIKQIESESKQKTLTEGKKLDLGFRVFKLDRSNFKKWDNQAEDLQKYIVDHVDQIKSESNPEDVLYEILIKDGFELTTNIKKVQVKGKDVYSIENNLLLICLDEKLDLDLFKEMKKLNPHLVIVLDKGFKDNDQLKTNAVQTLGKNSDEEYILRSI